MQPLISYPPSDARDIRTHAHAAIWHLRKEEKIANHLSQSARARELRFERVHIWAPRLRDTEAAILSDPSSSSH